MPSEEHARCHRLSSAIVSHRRNPQASARRLLNAEPGAPLILRYPLIHSPLLEVLAAGGHGSRILIADGNYAHRTNSHRDARVVHLNLRPGLLRYLIRDRDGK